MGIEEYYDKWFFGVMDLLIFGVFVMIEIGYGFDVVVVGIIVMYDLEIEEFVIYMLFCGVVKEYFGNVVLYGIVVIVFV